MCAVKVFSETKSKQVVYFMDVPYSYTNDTDDKYITDDYADRKDLENTISTAIDATKEAPPTPKQI